MNRAHEILFFLLAVDAHGSMGRNGRRRRGVRCGTGVAGLSIYAERKLIDALVSIGWKRHLDAESCAAIVQALDCSDAEAKAMLDYLYLERGLIRQVSSRAEQFDEYRPKSALRWRWIAT